jgi:hypothetical protein
MGRYITYDEVTVRFPLLKTWSDKESHINSFMIYYAENQVDEMLAPAYSTPFSAAHPTVKDLSLDFCKYRMLLDQDAEKAEAIFNIISARIEKLLGGEQYITTDSGSIAPSAASDEVWSNTGGYLPTHTMLGADDPYTRVDSGLQADLENERI